MDKRTPKKALKKNIKKVFLAPKAEHNNIELTNEIKEEDLFFSKIEKGISTPSEEQKDIPKGLWTNCPKCNEIWFTEELEKNLFVCKKCSYHLRIDSKTYFKILFDKEQYQELFNNISPKNFLNFTDIKPYEKRIEEETQSLELKDAIRVGVGNIKNQKVVVACMDFKFIGGSMGSVVGEKFARGVDYAITEKIPFIVISKSGGARMQESAFSLMQMPKTCAKLSQLTDEKLPYISILTDPTFGGVTASFAMLGDINIAEPKALIGFAGPEVIKALAKTDFPPGFQRSEFLLEKGFLDKIVPRTELKNTLGLLIALFQE
ncbi:MAG: acetyl-CoA carboxylase, carboxyltransferase subunit beta [Chitinophagaceae bacterium]